MSSVQEDSPASRENFKAGDEILAINLLPIEYWDLSGINDLLRSEPDRKILFTIRRNINGIIMELEKEITLEKQL